MKRKHREVKSDRHAEDQKKRDLLVQTLENIKDLLDAADYDAERTDILNYAIGVIAKDVAYCVAARPLYGTDIPLDSSFRLPDWKESIICEGVFSLENVTVISETYKPRKLRSAICEVFRQGFRKEARSDRDTTGILYKEINLFVAGEGKHHLSAAMLKNSGSANMRVCSLEKMFPVWKTDGAYWYHDGETPLPVFDCRMAILYELARMKSERMLPGEPHPVKHPDVFLPPCGIDAYFTHINYRYQLELLETEVALKQEQIDILKSKGAPSNMPECLAALENSVQDMRRDYNGWFSIREAQWKNICTGCNQVREDLKAERAKTAELEKRLRELERGLR